MRFKRFAIDITHTTQTTERTITTINTVYGIKSQTRHIIHSIFGYIALRRRIPRKNRNTAKLLILASNKANSPNSHSLRAYKRRRALVLKLFFFMNYNFNKLLFQCLVCFALRKHLLCEHISTGLR